MRLVNPGRPSNVTDCYLKGEFQERLLDYDLKYVNRGVEGRLVRRVGGIGGVGFRPEVIIVPTQGGFLRKLFVGPGEIVADVARYSDNEEPGIEVRVLNPEYGAALKEVVERERNNGKVRISLKEKN